jgi:hypothetical protein
MGNKAQLIIAVLVVVALLFFAWLLLEQEQAVDGSSESGDVIEVSTPVEPASVPVQDQEIESGTKEKVQIEPSEDREIVPLEKKEARIHGRFVLPDGTPASGVEIKMTGMPSNEEEVRKHGFPLFWLDPSTMSDEEGLFEIRFSPPQAYQFTLDAKLEGYSEVSWRWGNIRFQEDKDLGTIKLDRSGVILVTIRNTRGEVLKTGWTVYADSPRPGGHTGRDNTQARAKTDPATGVARLVDMSPGPAQLNAYSHIANWIDGPIIEVVAGEEVEAEIRYSGPDNSRRIVVSVWEQPFRFPEVDASSIMISSDGYSWRPSRKIPGSSQSYAFDDLSPGLYSVKIEDERFDPWSMENIERGRTVTATISCNAALEVTVVDATSNEPLDDIDLQIHFGIARLSPTVTITYNRLHWLPSPDKSGIYTGIPPGIESSLIVNAEGYAELKLPIGTLAPNETRAVEARMKHSAEIRGIVVRSDGKTPVAGVQVQLQPPGEPPLGPWDVETDYMETADSSGRFRFARVMPGTWSLHAYMNPWILTSVESMLISEGEKKEDLRLQLPPASFLQGHLIGEPGFSFKGMHLRIRPSAGQVMEGFWDEEVVNLEVAADGTFQYGPLPPGETTLSLSYPFSTYGGRSHSIILAELTLEAGIDMKEQFVLGERAPGSVRVFVSQGGTPLAGHAVQIGASGALTDAGGIAVVGPIFPGDWSVSVFNPLQSREWKYVKPETFRVEPGKQSECTVNVLMIAGRIRIYDATSEKPLAGQEVWLTFPDDSQHKYQTDVEGWLDLNLSPGIYLLSDDYQRNPRDGENQVNLTWTFTGPVIDKVKLRLRDEK